MIVALNSIELPWIENEYRNMHWHCCCQWHTQIHTLNISAISSLWEMLINNKQLPSSAHCTLHTHSLKSALALVNVHFQRYVLIKWKMLPTCIPIRIYNLRESQCVLKWRKTSFFFAQRIHLKSHISINSSLLSLSFFSIFVCNVHRLNSILHAQIQRQGSLSRSPLNLYSSIFWNINCKTRMIMTMICNKPSNEVTLTAHSAPNTNVTTSSNNVANYIRIVCC